MEDYPHAREEVDSNLPAPYGSLLEIVTLVDSENDHNLLVMRSLNGLLVYVGLTLVYWSAKIQVCVVTSIYSAEFIDLKEGNEQAMDMHYYLSYWGVPIPNDCTHPTKIFCDNFSVIQSASNPKAGLSKKNFALSFHFAREAIAAGIVVTYWLKGEINISNILTKQISSSRCLGHLDTIYWREN